MPRPRRNRPPDPSKVQSMTDGMTAPEPVIILSSPHPDDTKPPVAGETVTLSGSGPFTWPGRDVVAREYANTAGWTRTLDEDGTATVTVDPLGHAILTGEVPPALVLEGEATGERDGEPTPVASPALSPEWHERLDEVCASIDALATDAPRLVVEVPPELVWRMTYVNARGEEMDGPSGTEPDPVDAAGYEDPPIACGTFTTTACDECGRVVDSCSVILHEDDKVRCVRCTINGYPADPRLRPLGDALRAAREASGKTMGEVADAIGVSVTTISDWERGRVLPSADEFERFTDALEVADLHDLDGVLREWHVACDAMDAQPTDIGDAPNGGDGAWSPTPVEVGPDYVPGSLAMRFDDAVLGRLIAPVRPVAELPAADWIIVDDGPLTVTIPAGREYIVEYADPEAGHKAAVSACLSSPATALEVYRAVATGKVKIASWEGPELRSVGAGEVLGRVYPRPEKGWAGRVGNAIEEFDTEEEARVSVVGRVEGVGWSVVRSSKGRK